MTVRPARCVTAFRQSRSVWGSERATGHQLGEVGLGGGTGGVEPRRAVDVVDDEHTMLAIPQRPITGAELLGLVTAGRRDLTVGAASDPLVPHHAVRDPRRLELPEVRGFLGAAANAPARCRRDLCHGQDGKGAPGARDELSARVSRQLVPVSQSAHALGQSLGLPGVHRPGPAHQTEHHVAGHWLPGEVLGCHAFQLQQVEEHSGVFAP